MKVKELIAKLSTYDPELPVIIEPDIDYQNSSSE
jgi:hypothetical protein